MSIKPYPISTQKLDVNSFDYIIPSISIDSLNMHQTTQSLTLNGQTMWNENSNVNRPIYERIGEPHSVYNWETLYRPDVLPYFLIL